MHTSTCHTPWQLAKYTPTPTLLYMPGMAVAKDVLETDPSIHPGFSALQQNALCMTVHDAAPHNCTILAPAGKMALDQH